MAQGVSAAEHRTGRDGTDGFVRSKTMITTLAQARRSGWSMRSRADLHRRSGGAVLRDNLG